MVVGPALLRAARRPGAEAGVRGLAVCGSGRRTHSADSPDRASLSFPMRIGVLGTTVATDGSGPVGIGGPKQRALLAALALHRGRAVAVDTLADIVWNGARHPESPARSRGYVAGLRRAWSPSAPRGWRDAARHRAARPRAAAARGDLDTAAFEAVVSAAHTAVAPLADACAAVGPCRQAPGPGHLDRLTTSRASAGALAGTPYADLGDVPAAEAERARLEELRLLAAEDRAALGVPLGLHATVAASRRADPPAHPLRERAMGAAGAFALAGSGARPMRWPCCARCATSWTRSRVRLEPGRSCAPCRAAVLRQDARRWRRGASSADPGGSGGSGGQNVPPLPTLWGWSLAGRDEELAAPTALVDEHRRQAPTAVQRSSRSPASPASANRLAIEAATYAADRPGVAIAWGRCSQDDGAPALWPWATVLERLGSELPSGGGEGGEDSGAAFRAWEAVVDQVLAAATAGP